MTLGKANKSKILTLILGLITSLALMLGIAFASPADTARAAETDTRIVVSKITATSDVDDIVGFGKSVVQPTFNIVEDVPAWFSTSGNWKRKTATGSWDNYSGTAFMEGTYRYRTQIRIDSTSGGGTTHVLDKNGITVTVDGVKWADNSKPLIDDAYSFDWVFSKEYEVVKPTTVAITDELVPVTDLEKVFNAAAQEPTFGGTLVLGADYEVGYTVKAGAGGALDMGGKPVDAGTYVVTVTGKGAYEGSFTKEFVINKAEKSAPVGLFANPISCTDGSGAINGATTAMEYRKVGDADFTACTSSTISGLAAAEYEVRYAEDKNYLASDVVTVTVAISHNLGALEEETPATCSATGMKAHYYCPDCRKFFDESKNETTEAALTIAINPNAHDFGEWIAEVQATCVATGTKGHKDCRICNKHFDESENEITEAALTIPANDNHDWNAWASNLDGTHSRTCKRDGSHKENGNCSGGTATCENKAVCSVCGAEYGGKLGHDWGEVKYTWTGNDACKAERVCKRDSAHIESETATATAEEIKAATCKEKGRMKYTATFENVAFAMQEKEVDIDLVPHSFGDLIDETPATCVATGMKAHYHCSVCEKYFDESKNETTEAALTIPANDNHDWNAWSSNGNGTHTRTCKRDSSHKENGKCSGGKATCTTKAVCDVCRTTYGNTAPHNTTKYNGKDSSGHWDTCSTCHNRFNFEKHTPNREKADETNPVKCAKCGFVITPAGHYEHTADSEWHNSADGTYHYHKCTYSGCSEILDKADHSGGTATCENKAVCSVCGAEYGEKLGHNWGEVKYTWTGNDACKAERVCKHDSAHIESETATATAEEIKAATCKEKGRMKYTATFENAAFAMQEKEVDTDLAPHNFGAWVDEVPATKETTGTKAHKDCEICGKHFDKDGNEITDLTIEKLPSDVKESDSGESSGEVIEPEKDGLSDGAIAGIVIGSVAVAGIGGFAIFWFAVKKKSFADLFAAIKALFTKKK